MKRGITRFYPPGYDYEKWNGRAILLIVAMVMAQLIIYAGRFGAAFGDLYWNNDHTVIIDGRIKMPPFPELAKGCLLPLAVFAVYCILWAVLMRATFSQNSNSIYIMKRLDSSKELWIRCISAPAAFTLIALLATAAMLLIFRLHYEARVPDMCNPADLSDYLRSLEGYTSW